MGEKEAAYRFILIRKKFKDTSDTMAATGPAESYSAQHIEISHKREYTRSERIQLALAHYHVKRYEAEVHPGRKKPVVLQIAKLYGIAEPTLRRHINNPGQHTIVETTPKTQALTVAEEALLVQRLVFLNDTNVSAN